MRPTVEERIKQSREMFRKWVWPQIAQHCGGGALSPVEGRHLDSCPYCGRQLGHRDLGFAELMDRATGIDWLVEQDGLVRGLAVRIQTINPNRQPFDTFSIRANRASGGRTELTKRHRSCTSDMGWLYPHWTVQAYCADELLSAGVIATTEMYRLLLNGAPYRENVNTEDRTGFLSIRWADLRSLGAKTLFAYHRPSV